MVNPGEPEPPACQEPWGLYFVGDADDFFASDFFRSIAATTTNDKKYIRNGLELLIKHAANGKEFKNVYDKKDCHDAFSFLYEHKEYTVWRIRKGPARIYYYDTGNKIILLCGATIKNKDKLSAAEKNELARHVKEFIAAGKNVAYMECEHENDG